MRVPAHRPVQAFSAQDRATLARVRSLVLGQHLRLVFRVKHRTLRPVNSGSRAPSSTAVSAKVIVIGCYSLLAPCRGKELNDRVLPQPGAQGCSDHDHLDSEESRKGADVFFGDVGNHNHGDV